ncbi:hypothetical protein H5P28_12375 [Ruficoccus amylovorans]|uniref:Uncharacterized protein n=1 Tax=Ruficoccus amylovorans TaxID=1804625 RepID=A0A842HHL0_9BACT|nr:hypothetical protein [Ruficoccus amylovorans]MBC2595054.1 hypothetical protein [Ruficoccus amylovorans]
MSNTAPETSHSNYLFSIFGALGSMLLFFIIILIAYVYMQRPSPVDQQTIDNRLAKFADVTAKETALTTQYAWVNQKEGIVRVPVDLAMQLAVKEIAAKPDGIFPPAEATPPAPASDDKASADAEQASADAGSSDEKPADESKSAAEETSGDKPAADTAAQSASGEGAQEAK